jgi:hypothetical protein
VSSGRLGAYVVVIFILIAGAAGYLLMSRRRGSMVAFVAIGTLGAAALLSGSRGTIVYTAATALVMVVGFLWGVPQRRGQGRRLAKAIRRFVLISALSLAAVLVLFPEQAGSRIAFYTQTLSPNSAAYEGSARIWTYPLDNLRKAFHEPNWLLGNGIGVASLGTQYVARLLKQPQPEIWVEEGFGVLIVELGVIGPLLWILWSGAMVYCCWRVTLRLRKTPYFPVAFAIFWYTLLLLWILTWSGFAVFENYVNNAYLWLLVGVLFRLPDLQANTTLAGLDRGSDQRKLLPPEP